MTDRTALLVLDMINTFDFPRGAALLRASQVIAPRVARLKARVKASDGLCVYVNDNFAGWSSDFQALVALAGQSAGQRVLDVIQPHADDMQILKPRHSAFYQTALASVLGEARVQRVLVAGVSAEACVLATALDAHILDLDVCVISDCVASSSSARRTHALAVMRYCNLRTATAAKVRLS
jgi:nicotinamidase-related amidase